MDTVAKDLKIPTIADIGVVAEEEVADEAAVDPPRDPLEFLLDVMQGRTKANPAQLRAAVAAAQYIHKKTHDGGRKEADAKAAHEAAAGRFGGRATPLKLVSGGA